MAPNLSYDAFPVRADLSEAHQRFWAELAKPGSWWTGAERVAIAAEVRNVSQCALCQARKQALTPSSVTGEHDSLGALPAAAVEVVHQVTSDPGRLSKRWFDEAQAAGLSDGQYVELIGVLVALVSVDSFCRGLGIPVHALPQPVAGEPSGYRPASAIDGVGWLPMIPSDAVTGAEAGLYPAKRMPNVLRALSLVPDAARIVLDLLAAHYVRVGGASSERAIDRSQTELIAGRVSALRECFY